MHHKEKAKQIASFLGEDREETLSVLEEVCDLVEAQAPCVDCQAARPEPKPRISTRTIAWAALAVGLFLPPLIPLDEIIGVASAFRGPALGLHEAALDTPVIRVGEPLVLKVKSQYLRVCMWRWSLEWRRAADGYPIAMNWVPGTGHVIGAVTEQSFAIGTPAGLKPGNYILHQSATGECEHSDPAQIIDPDMYFTVTD